jgi:integrase
MQINLGRGHGNKRRGTGAIPATNWRLLRALHASWNDRCRFRSVGVEVYARDECPYVVHYHGRGIDSVDLSNAYARAGIVGANVHTLKHTCCTWLVQGGVSYERIAKLIGTTARMIELHYGHEHPSHLETAGELLTV